MLKWKQKPKRDSSRKHPPLHTHSFSVSLCLSLCLTLSLSINTHTHICSLSLSPSHPHLHSLSHMHTHTHIHSLSHTFFLSLPQFLYIFLLTWSIFWAEMQNWSSFPPKVLNRTWSKENVIKTWLKCWKWKKVLRSGIKL